jgi:hypothetical protein
METACPSATGRIEYLGQMQTLKLDTENVGYRRYIRKEYMRDTHATADRDKFREDSDRTAFGGWWRSDDGHGSDTETIFAHFENQPLNLPFVPESLSVVFEGTRNRPNQINTELLTDPDMLRRIFREKGEREMLSE